jgi:uncharacterized RDD family membrane protein YckC
MPREAKPLPSKPLYEISTIETPERIAVEIPLAGVGTRAVAYLIDLCWQVVPLILLGVIAYAILPGELRPSEFYAQDAHGQPKLPLPAIAFMSMVMFVTNFGYFALFELLWKGQSPGKRALGIRVVRDGGLPVDGRASLIRNLLRSVDILPGTYLVGIFTLLLGGQGKRVGDYAAGTLVVRELPEPEPAVTAATRSASTPDLLTPAERSLVSEFLARRPGFSPVARVQLASDLAQRLSNRLGRPAPLDAEAFLEQL